eukprot:gene8929-878_t
MSENKFRFSIDRGGTFTDFYAELPNGDHYVDKLLSVDPKNYNDAPTEGIRRIMEKFSGKSIPTSKDIDTSQIEWIRMGTTVATNALLERQGEPFALIVTKGFRDLLEIGNQSRPHIFDLAIKRPGVLYKEVVEIDERVRVLSNEEEKEESNFKNIQKGLSDSVEVLKEINYKEVEEKLKKIKDEGINSIAVVLLHAYTFTKHEVEIGKIAKELGFGHVSMSHEVIPMIKAVNRGLTTCVDAYLTPIIKQYLQTFTNGFKDDLKGVNVTFMQSDGGLAPSNQFTGYKAILSGPAGGVVGYSETAYNKKEQVAVIGFDMGGTSTDVSRFDGKYEHIYENFIAGATIQAPQLDIRTVAAGGGSRLFFVNGMFKVGPESASSHPGPLSYRKNGYLAITDANLFLGRVLPDYFPKIFGEKEDQPLDVEVTKVAFKKLTEEINQHLKEHGHKTMTEDEVAYGFIRVANAAMARPIRAITVSKGYDTRDHILSIFGGAGPQHACEIAQSLGMKKIFISRFGGILSAYGLGLADVVHEEQRPCSKTYNKENLDTFLKQLKSLEELSVDKLSSGGFPKDKIKTTYYLNMRYSGTDFSIMTDVPEEEKETTDYQKQFEKNYQRQYGFTIKGREIIVDDIRVRSVGISKNIKRKMLEITKKEVKPIDYSDTYFEGGRVKTPIYALSDLSPGVSIKGPCIISQKISTIIITPSSIATITNEGDIEINVESSLHNKLTIDLDPVQLTIFNHRFMSIAEQMGNSLQRTAISTNIKERLDFSCALFGPSGGLVANAPHLPVHLGSMSEAVRWQLKNAKDWKEGEVILTNHPAAGGSHLPDITVITPVYENGKPVFFVASRGHHADIGGISPGSMPPFSRKLSEEGAAIKSFKLVKDNTFQLEGICELLKESRLIEDNLADLKAQVAANQKGISLVKELISEYSLEVVQAYMVHVQNNAEFAVQNMLKEMVEIRGKSILEAEDFMDDGSNIKLKVSINTEEKTAVFDFSGTSAMVLGNINAPRAVSVSAVLYCLRCLIKKSIPLNDGCLKPIKVIIPENSILCPSEEAGVVGGNVLTSQRVTDVILKAFNAASASQGCMNNLTFGNEKFGFYETIAGGSGAGPTWNGVDGVHTHMTNTRITDVEIMEKRYPVMITQFSLRHGSGGKGKFKGGDGVIREFYFLKPLFVGILSERRVYSPFGLEGGEDGAKGKNILKTKNGNIFNVGGKNAFNVEAGDTFSIYSPGGGGFGKK